MQKISIIVPVYNTVEFIDDCLNSLCSQTYNNIEIILINDGSKPCNTKELETKAKYDKRIKLYHFEKRKGVGAVRNYGVKKATGDYVYFMDSDDYLPERTLEILIKHINSFDIIRGKIKQVNTNKSFAILYRGVYDVKIYTENKFNLIKNNSCLNFLIRRNYIIENNLSFSEDIEVFSDLNFIAPALNNAKNVAYIKEAVYFKKSSSDPIKRPSLSQLEEEVIIRNFLFTYMQLKAKFQGELLNEYLDKQLLNLYRKDILRFFAHEKNIDSIFENLSEAMKLVSPNIIKEYDYVLKKEVKPLKKGKIRKYKRVNRRHQFLRSLRNGLKTKRKFFRFLHENFFVKMPIKSNMIVFESFSGKSYSDSPKYIYEYMLENNIGKKHIWFVNETMCIPGNPTQVKRLSLRYFYYLARAKYWVSNARFPNYIQKREENIYLQTWHGTPLKKLAGDMDDVYMPGTNPGKYKQNFYNETQKWDFLVSPNSYSSKIFQRAFWFQGKIIESGYPRNDILYLNNNEESINKIKKKLGLPIHKKVIMYAPTWRDDEYYSKGNYKFNLKLDLNRMKQTLGEEYIILLRMHYLIASKLNISEYSDFAIDLSNYSDISELYLISDILITDYSSVFFDYANLKRPILFFTYDFEKYRDELRGFYIDMEKELPGPLLTNNNEILNAIVNINEVEKEYRNRYEDFYCRFCSWDDGNASKRVVETVFNKIR